MLESDEIKMKYFLQYLSLWIGFSAILAIVSTGVAQSRVELVHADFSRGQTYRGNEEVKILEGNVFVRQDTMEIYCDKAVYHKTQNRIVLSGNVRLVRGKEILTAQQVTYYEQQKMAIAEQNVFLQRPGQTLRSEYLKYFYETDRSFARTNLVLKDVDSRMTVTAQRGEYLPQQNRSRVEKNAHFWQVSNDGADTLHIFAEDIEYIFKPERVAIAKNAVRIKRGELTATCDSATYLMEKDRVYLNQNPMAHQKSNELTGDQIELTIEDMKINQILVSGNAVATSVEDSLKNKINRLTGREIIAKIVEQQIESLQANDNAQSKYYLKDDGAQQGVNTATADTILIFFKESEVNRILVKGGSQGIYTPADTPVAAGQKKE